MSLTWERLAGRTDRFALRLALADDPDGGEGVDPDVAASWGSFQLWVDGRNLCAHTELGEVVESVHWYLLPLVEWLVANWDPLLHEERLPARNADFNAVSSLQRTRFPPANASDDDAAKWEHEWGTWWRRHSLQAARDGGLFPDVILRRWRDSIEVSWDTQTLAGAPPEVGFEFIAPTGAARLEPADVAVALEAAMRDIAVELLGRAPENARYEELLRRIDLLADPTRAQARAGWLAGLASSAAETGERWRELIGRAGSAARTQLDAVFGSDHEGLVIAHAPTAGLVFGSLAPELREEDVDAIVQLLVDVSGGTVERGRLDELASSVPLPRNPADVVEQAIELAEELTLALALPLDSPVDMDVVLSELGVSSRSIELSDPSVRGIAVAGATVIPTTALNTSYPWSARRAVARFSLAHELCHLLFDRGAGSRVAVASGQWAPRDLERRANAFAAYFLMPLPLVEEAVRQAGVHPRNAEGLRRVANWLETSFSATLEQLFNFGFVDEFELEGLRDEFHWSRMGESSG